MNQLTSRQKIALTIVGTLTAAGTIVAAFFIPPASPAIIIGGAALASIIAGEVVKYYVATCMNRNNPPGGLEDELESQPPARPNTPDIESEADSEVLYADRSHHTLHYVWRRHELVRRESSGGTVTETDREVAGQGNYTNGHGDKVMRHILDVN